MSWDMLARKADFDSLATSAARSAWASCSACSARSSSRARWARALLAPVEAVQDDAQAEGRNRDGGHHDQGDVHRLGLALDGLHGHITHQIGGAVADGPQIAEGLGALHLMGEHDVLAVFDAVRHHGEDGRIGDVVGPVEVLQVHMPRIALAHALGLQHEALRGGVHEIEHGPLAVEALGQRLVDGVEGVLGVQLGDGDAVRSMGHFTV